MVAGSPQGRLQDLDSMARERFGGLSKAELVLLRAVPKGRLAVCGPPDPKNPANDPAKADTWGPEREIRAELIRWLCLGPEAARHVDPKGIQVHGAKVVGELDLSFANVPFPIAFFRCHLTHDAHLMYARVPVLNLNGTWTRSIAADGARVAGGVFLRKGFRAEGEVRLLGAKIGGQLDCTGSSFKNPDGIALNADGVNVQGDVFLCEGFGAEGEVRLLGAQIGGDLACNGGRFTQARAHTARIEGNFYWQAIAGAQKAHLDLKNASVGAIVDDEVSWPAAGNLNLDGFVYGRISEGPMDAQKRLEWLGRLNRFTLQPYRQLATVLCEMGDTEGARHVLFEMERRRRIQEDRSCWARLWSQLLEITIGYGHKPWRAIEWLVRIMVLGFVLFGSGYFGGGIVPTDKGAYDSFEQTGAPLPYYPRFNALVYSLEHSFPLVDLGQKDHWGPSPDGPGRSPVSSSRTWSSQVLPLPSDSRRLAAGHAFRLRARRNDARGKVKLRGADPS